MSAGDERAIHASAAGRRKRSRPGFLTLADARFLVEVVARRTLALETAEGVDADPALAEARQLLALVDVCGRLPTVTVRDRACCSGAAGGQTLTFQDDGDGVGPEALASGTQRLVFRCGEKRPVSANFPFRQTCDVA